MDMNNFFPDPLYVLCHHYTNNRIVLAVGEDGVYRAFEFPERRNLSKLLTRSGTFRSLDEIAVNMMEPEGGSAVDIEARDVIRSMAAAMLDRDREG